MITFGGERIFKLGIFGKGVFSGVNLLCNRVDVHLAGSSSLTVKVSVRDVQIIVAGVMGRDLVELVEHKQRTARRAHAGQAQAELEGAWIAVELTDEGRSTAPRLQTRTSEPS